MGRRGAGGEGGAPLSKRGKGFPDPALRPHLLLVIGEKSEGRGNPSPLTNPWCLGTFPYKPGEEGQGRAAVGATPLLCRGGSSGGNHTQRAGRRRLGARGWRPGGTQPGSWFFVSASSETENWGRGVISNVDRKDIDLIRSSPSGSGIFRRKLKSEKVFYIWVQDSRMRCSVQASFRVPEM